MLEKTRGIVLTHYKYGEAALIVHIFTEEFGMQGYLVHGVWKKNAKLKSVLFQPLTLLDMEVYHKPKGGLQRIKEAGLSEANANILSDIVKTTIGLFIAEVLHKTLKTEVQEEQLYQFVYAYSRKLELENKGLATFILEFLRAYSVVLGVCPQAIETSEEKYFDMLNGEFLPEAPLHAYYLTEGESTLFNKSVVADYNSFDNEPFTKQERQLLTDWWVKYYLLHFENIREIKSLNVLREVFY